MMDSTLGEKQFLTFEGQRLAFLAAGDPAAPALVMVHGWSSHSGVFWPLLEAFRDTHYCVALDLLGHADSDKPVNGDYSIAANARRVLALADHLGLDRFTLIGHSMGGQIGCFLALNAPGRVERLVSIAGVVTGRLSRYVRWVHLPVFAAGARFPELWEFSRIALRRDWRWYINIFDRPVLYEPEMFPVKSVDHDIATRAGSEVPFYRELIEIARCDLSGQIGKITQPTLVIFGKQDGTVPLVNGYLAKQRIPGATLVLLDRCGHSPLAEQPTQVVAAVRAFLAGK